MKKSLFAIGFTLLVSTAASAVPVLQLDIAGGSYDNGDETIVTSADSFTVYAYATPSGNMRRSSILGQTYYLSDRADARDGRRWCGARFVHRERPRLRRDGRHDVRRAADRSERHRRASMAVISASTAIYSTHFVEIPFTFSAANRSGEYNTADDAGQGPIAGNDMYYAAFTVDKSLLDDAASAPLRPLLGRGGSPRRSRSGSLRAVLARRRHRSSPVPEPTAALIFGGALLLTKVSTAPPQLAPARVDRRDAAVDDERLSRHEARRVAREEDRGGLDVVLAADAAERDRARGSAPGAPGRGGCGPSCSCRTGPARGSSRGCPCGASFTARSIVSDATAPLLAL